MELPISGLNVNLVYWRCQEGLAPRDGAKALSRGSRKLIYNGCGTRWRMGLSVVSWRRIMTAMPVTYETWLVLLSIFMAI